MNKFIFFCIAVGFVLSLASVQAVWQTVYNGTINVNVGEAVEVVIGNPAEFEVIERCVNNTERCEGAINFLCVNNLWVNQGQVNGKCNYSPPIGGGGLSGGGISSGGFVSLCGNGRCDSDESEESCPQDCKQTLQPLATGNNQEEKQNESDLSRLTNSNKEDKNNVGGITGAVIGVLGTTGGFVVIVFVSGIIALLIIIFSVRRKGQRRKKK